MLLTIISTIIGIIAGGIVGGIIGLKINFFTARKLRKEDEKSLMLRISEELIGICGMINAKTITMNGHSFLSLPIIDNLQDDYRAFQLLNKSLDNEFNSFMNHLCHICINYTDKSIKIPTHDKDQLTVLANTLIRKYK